MLHISENNDKKHKQQCVWMLRAEWRVTMVIAEVAEETAEPTVERLNIQVYRAVE